MGAPGRLGGGGTSFTSAWRLRDSTESDRRSDCSAAATFGRILAARGVRCGVGVAASYWGFVVGFLVWLVSLELMVRGLASESGVVVS